MDRSVGFALTSAMRTTAKTAPVAMPSATGASVGDQIVMQVRHRCSAGQVVMTGQRSVECPACGQRFGVYDLGPEEVAFLARFLDLARDASPGPWKAERHA